MRDPQGFPQQSPDLNPIEMIWSYLNQMVKARSPITTNQLVTAIRQCWTKLPQSIIQKSILTLSNRVKFVFENNGVEYVSQ